MSFFPYTCLEEWKGLHQIVNTEYLWRVGLSALAKILNSNFRTKKEVTFTKATEG